MNNELRWRQRFQNFERAYGLLDEVITKGVYSLSTLEQEGVIQRFAILIELSWKVLKDYLENEGYEDIQNAKKAIRQAFQDEIIRNPEDWMQALEKRSITSHMYNDAILAETITFIERQFYPIVRDLYFWLKKEL